MPYVRSADGAHVSEAEALDSAGHLRSGYRNIIGPGEYIKFDIVSMRDSQAVAPRLADARQERNSMTAIDQYLRHLEAKARTDALTQAANNPSLSYADRAVAAERARTQAILDKLPDHSATKAIRDRARDNRYTDSGGSFGGSSLKPAQATGQVSQAPSFADTAAIRDAVRRARHSG